MALGTPRVAVGSLACIGASRLASLASQQLARLTYSSLRRLADQFADAHPFLISSR